LILALALLVLAADGGVLSNGFVSLDDDDYVVRNVRVGAGLTGGGLAWSLTSIGHASNWHPLTWLSHMADVQFYGLDPRGHHLTSLLLHLAGTILLFLVLRRATGALWRSGLVAALFAAHPLHVESVAWVAERKNVLSGLFWTVSLGAYLNYVRRPAAGRYLAVALALALGLMAKQTLVALPLVLLLLDWWPLGRFAQPACGSRPGLRGPARLLLEKVPLALVAGAAGWLAYLAQSRGGALQALELPFGVRAANAVSAASSYIVKAAWPEGFAVFYPHPGPSISWAGAAASGAALAAATVLAVRGRARRPYLALGWFWYLVTLAPVIGLVQVGWQAMADRYAYLPLVGLFLAIAWFLGDRAATAPRRGVRAATALPAVSAVLALAAASSIQAGYWRDGVTLFERARAVTGDNWLAEYLLGNEFLRLRRGSQASNRFRTAIKLNPGFADAYNNLGAQLLLDGKTAEALPVLTQAVRLAPRDPALRFNLGLALEGEGNPGAAASQYREALRLRPEYSAARARLEIALRRGREADMFPVDAGNPSVPFHLKR
jgi:tetratricopeptide (TPR) repeat protein